MQLAKWMMFDTLILYYAPTVVLAKAFAPPRQLVLSRPFSKEKKAPAFCKQERLTGIAIL
jgi:hypothetical protein